MKSTELRIGNAVTTPNGVQYVTQIVDKWIRGSIRKYVSVSDKSIGNNRQYELQEISPIPLTPEVMKRLGFVISTKKSLEKYGSCHYFLEMDNEKLFYIWYGVEKMNFVFYHGESYTELLYVHQIQNLYRILFSKEIEFNTEVGWTRTV